MSIIDKIDRLLEAYYKFHKRNDYKNADGIGKFKQFCDDNGFEENDIADEMQAPPDDCMLVDFDKDENENNIFPLYDTYNNEKEKQSAILEVINYMNTNNKIPKLETDNEPQSPKISTTIQKLGVNLYIQKNVAEEIINRVYKPQMKCLGKFNESDLMYFFAVGYANKIPFLTWMVDAFTLDKTQYFVKNKITMTLEDWIRHNKFMKDLIEKDSNKAEKLKVAMCGYSNRIIPRLQYAPTTKIKDNITEIVDYISAVPQFINALIISDKSQISPPFCIDLSFAVRKVVPCVANLESEITDGDGLSEDDDVYDEKNDGLNPKKDHIGDLHKKLKIHKCGFAAKDVPPTVFDNNNINDINDTYEYKKDNDLLLTGFSRFLMDGYNEFRSILHRKSVQNLNLGIEAEDKHEFSDETYPRNKRFGIFVDRRKHENENENENEKPDKVTFFEQLVACDTIIQNHVAEWFMEAARQCIIPGIHPKAEKKQQTPDKVITATDNVCGQLMTFSFHVEAKDEIRCYIIWNGQTMRFRGDNLVYILEMLFVKDEWEEKQLKKQLSKFDDQVIDAKFQEFYAQMQNGYIRTEEYIRYGQ